MASSSSSPSVVSTKHDVFLSFRGGDTRHNFISHLYQALQNKKIQTFKDDEKLNRGEEISPALLTAIRGSKISLVIFSENYGNSKWCLDELVTILECRQKDRQIVVPVFYKVDPTSVRNQTGNFGSSFHQLANNYESKEERWRMALKEAGSLSGWESSELGSEAILVEKLVDSVLQELKILSKHDDCDLKGLVGINSRIEKIVHLLDIESSGFRIVGIWGMGGIGKSTIAEIVYYKIRGKFERSYFLANVREMAKKDGLTSMRNNLISKLLNDQKLEIDTLRIGDGSIKDRLSRTKVLLALDDIDDSSQLEKLIGERGMNQFGQGSRVIVTTRDKHVLNAHDIPCVYDMDMLDERDALELFTYHALRPDQPMEPYLEISKKIVEYAQGVPLALKILGSSLHGKTDIEDWKGELKKLKKLPNMKISDVLKISYDGLTQEEKDIFLDIVCFFKGANNHEVRNVLDSLYVSSHSGMKVLVDKSLITISTVVGPFTFLKNYPVPSKRLRFKRNSFHETKVEMHDLIEEMGWNIVNEESKEAGSRSRIWRGEDAHYVLTKNTGTDKIKAILYDVTWRELKEMNLDPQAFAKMHNLKFFRIMNSNIEFPSGLESLPEGLRYLDWDDCPLEYFPPTFNPTNLVQLHLSYCYSLRRLWSGKQNLHNLKVFNLNHCIELVEIPDLSLATNLEELNVVGCETLDKIPSSIQHCRSLKYLHLEDGYKEIPSFMHLTNLTHLDINIVPSSLQYLTNLTYLNFGMFFQEIDLTEIPTSIQYLTNLTHLKIMSKTLTEISSSIQYLTNLTHLYLRRCFSLKKISSSIQHLSNLTHLNLNHCSRLTEISFIQHLKNLTHLNLNRCSRLTEISFIQHLKNLTHLNLNYCKSLNTIPSSIQHLHSLTHFNMKDCIKITKLPKFPQNIKFLQVDGILVELNSLHADNPFGFLTNLVELELFNCTSHQLSSTFLEKIELLVPQGCKIIRN